MSQISSLFNTDKSIVMGVLNTTPDSFSDGGQFLGIDAALSQALKMHREGAAIIDVGGESTRPGAKNVSKADEIDRVIPVIQAIRKQSDVLISIDTSKPEVMSEAVKAGANIINDVNGLRAEGALDICAQLNVPVCVMHMQGEPRTMQTEPVYTDVVDDIKQFFEERITSCVKAGIQSENIILDPGFGFGKTLEHNLQLLKRLNEFQVFKLPVLVGLSRKSMLGKILNEPEPEKRVYASVAAAVLSSMNGANIFRVHDVKATVDALKVCDALHGV